MEMNDDFESGGAIRGLWNILNWGCSLAFAGYFLKKGLPPMAIIPLIIGAFLTVSRSNDNQEEPTSDSNSNSARPKKELEKASVVIQ